MNMARIALIGGHGKVALLAAPKLVAAGHQVTSVFRNPDHRDEVAATGATPLVADVETLDPDGLAEVLSGHDVVVWSAGAGGGNPARTYAVDRDAAIRSMAAAERAGVQRYVMISYLGARTDHGVPEDNSFFPYAEAKAAADARLRGTGLDWTILMPGQLTLEPSPGTLQPGAAETGPTSRELVADLIAATVDADPATVARTELPFIDGDVPIADALAGLRQG
jgi:uncharacterized protein YbjT (DUF2867 family)